MNRVWLCPHFLDRFPRLKCKISKSSFHHSGTRIRSEWLRSSFIGVGYQSALIKWYFRLCCLVAEVKAKALTKTPATDS